MKKSFLRIAATLVLTAAVAVPSFAAARGKADFTRLVTYGDSFGAGVSSVGLNIAHQRYSWAAVLARQVGLNTDCTADGPNCFQIPYISEPGILPELQLVSLSPLTIQLKPGLGTPINSGLQRPYNNLSMDGAEIADLLQVDGDGNEQYSGPIVLRGLGSAVDQGLSLNPTFIAMWIGGDDAFNAVQAGSPSALTPTTDFQSAYKTVLDKLTAGAPNAGFVVGNLPVDLRGIPFTSLIPPILINPATNKPVLDPATGNPIPLIADLGGGNFGPLPAGSLVLLTALDLVRSGYGIPAALAPLIPLPNVGKPLPDNQVLTPTELVAIGTRITEYNNVIATEAAARNIPVVDINAFFQKAKQGVNVGQFRFTLDYITGGLISLDGFHLTDIGYTLFANEYIKTINANYGTKIPLASIQPFLQNNGAFFPSTSSLSPEEVMGVTFTPEAMRAMNGRTEEAPKPRFRAVHH